MFVTEFLLAAALLLQPSDVPIDPEHFAVAPMLSMLALEWEVMDPREVAYIFARPDSFPTDLSAIRQRAADLADAPPVRDAYRFPDRATISEFLAFNRTYRSHVEIRQAGEPGRWWAMQATINETDRLYLLWDTLRDASSEYYYVTCRRHALANLRRMIGDRSYYEGRLPPWIPLHQFQPIDP